jgi:hypothetical protein
VVNEILWAAFSAGSFVPPDAFGRGGTPHENAQRIDFIGREALARILLNKPRDAGLGSTAITR